MRLTECQKSYEINKIFCYKSFLLQIEFRLYRKFCLFAMRVRFRVKVRVRSRVKLKFRDGLTVQFKSDLGPKF